MFGFIETPFLEKMDGVYYFSWHHIIYLPVFPADTPKALWGHFGNSGTLLGEVYQVVSQ